MCARARLGGGIQRYPNHEGRLGGGLLGLYVLLARGHCEVASCHQLGYPLLVGIRSLLQACGRICEYEAAGQLHFQLLTFFW